MGFRHTVGRQTFVFGDLKELMAKATPRRSGDMLAGIAAASAEESVAPHLGRTDADRNCVSNIRKAGLQPDQAADKIAWLVERAFALSLSGAALKDDSPGTLPAPTAAKLVGS